MTTSETGISVTTSKAPSSSSQSPISSISASGILSSAKAFLGSGVTLGGAGSTLGSGSTCSGSTSTSTSGSTSGSGANSPSSAKAARFSISESTEAMRLRTFTSSSNIFPALTGWAPGTAEPQNSPRSIRAWQSLCCSRRTDWVFLRSALFALMTETTASSSWRIASARFTSVYSSRSRMLARASLSPADLPCRTVGSVANRYFLDISKARFFPRWSCEARCSRWEAASQMVSVTSRARRTSKILSWSRLGPKSKGSSSREMDSSLSRS